MGLADGTVGDEDEDLGDQQCLCKFYFAYSFFIGIACAQQCVTSATSESSKDVLRRGRVGRGRGLLVLRAEAAVRVSSEVFGAFLCCCRRELLKCICRLLSWYFQSVQTVSI